MYAISEPFTAISHFRTKGGAFLLTCTKISQNHYFVQFRSAGGRGREVKTAWMLDFQGFFADRVVEATTRYSVSLSHLRETFPEQNTEKSSCRSRSGRLRPCSANLRWDSAKTFLKKHFTGAKRYYRAFVRCGVWGSKPHPFVISDQWSRCFLIDRLDYFLDYFLDYLLDCRH